MSPHALTPGAAVVFARRLGARLSFDRRLDAWVLFGLDGRVSYFRRETIRRLTRRELLAKIEGRA